QGVLISVNPQVETKLVLASETKLGEATFAPVSESHTESTQKGATPPETPGARPNVGMSVVETRTGSSSTLEKSDQLFATKIPETQKNETNHTGYALKIDVGVAVPWSYFRKVWELRNPSADG